MKILTTATIVAFGTVAMASMVWAEAKPVPLFWWSNHWEQQDFKPHVEDSRISHDYRWESDEWAPRDWISRHGSTEGALDALKSANIIKDFDDTSFWGKEKTPVLEVGYAFMQLSSRQKRRVAKFVDYAYNVSEKSSSGVMLLEDAKTNVTIGTYTKLGLQLN